jgi:hypothetical protein
LGAGLQQQQLQQSALQDLASRITGASPLAQLQAQQALASVPLQLQQRFGQQDIENQLALLGAARQQAGGGPGLGEVAAQAAGSALPIALTAALL